jgi:hypothetical protein
MNPSVFYAGYYGTVAFGTLTGPTNELSIVRWNVDANAVTIHFMNSRTGPIPVPAGTWQGYAISMQCDVDQGNPFFSGGPGFAIGTVLATPVSLYQYRPTRGVLPAITTPSSSTVPGWTFTSFYCQRISNPTDVEGTGKTRYAVSGEGFGTFTTPY